MAVAFYMAQLGIPFLLIGDVVLAWKFPSGLDALSPPLQWWSGFGTTGQFVFASSLLWLVPGLALLFLSTRIHLFKFEKLYGPLVSIYSLFIVLFLVEAGLQVASIENQPPALWRPGQEATLQADPDLMPGISGQAIFTGNDVGLRGPAFPTTGEVFKVITVGGSTTESLFLDDSEEWPHLIIENINAKTQDIPVWVGNGGQSGRNTLDHLALVQVLPVINKADLLIFMVGLNDMQPSLSLDGASTEELLSLNAALFKDQVKNGGGRLRPSRPYFKRLEIFELLKGASAGLIDDIAPASILNRISVGPGSFTAEKRRQRAEASVASMPDLSLGISEYQTRIKSISAECDSRELRCLFVTQPSMWRDDLPEYEKTFMKGSNSLT